MKVLVVGNGGREHAIAWKVAQNKIVEKVYCSPGNGGTAIEEKCENLSYNTVEELLNFALDNKIDLTIVGPEAFLCEGIVDRFKEKGLSIFGPSKEAAMLEGSKAFAKDFMKKYGVKTAAYETFEEKESALKYLKQCDYPIVLKADGLAAGKGVVIAQNFEEAEKTIEDFMVEDIFKGSGKKVVIEEYLEGVEASMLSITDGTCIIPFISAKDHKKIFEGEKGPNTGGMGAIAPNPYCTEEIMRAFKEEIMEPTLKGIKEEKLDYIGIIFFGLMITKKGVYLLEYNVRMGDPETQVVLPLMESDFVELINAALNKSLLSFNIKWSNLSACCIAGVSSGYPGKYTNGFEITGMDKIKEGKLFIAGAELKDGKLLTKGGRVINVTALGENLEKAREKSYEEIKNITFDGIYYRKDIGLVNNANL